MWRTKKEAEKLYEDIQKKQIEEEYNRLDEVEDVVKDFDYYVEQYKKDYLSAEEPGDNLVQESARQFFNKKLQNDLIWNAMRRYKNQTFV